MAEVGSLGSLITFQVSSNTVLTIESMTQSVKGRWATHSIIGSKPWLEFLGPDVRTISFPILLSSTLGIKPRSTIKAIEKAVEKGKTYKLVIGGKKIGSYNWAITDMSESWDVIILDGKLAQARLTLTLQEVV